MSDLQLQIINFLLTIGTAVLVPLLTALIFKALQKLNLNVSAQQEAKIKYFVQQAAMEAEEWGANKLKAKIPVVSADKLNRAVESILVKVPNITVEEAQKLVKTELAGIGLGATNFVQAVTTAAKS